MTLPASERRAQILSAVRQFGTVRVVELADRLEMSAVTLRRDLTALAVAGQLHRSHGAVTVGASAALAAPEVPAAPEASEAASARPVPSVGMLVPTVGSYFDEIIGGARAAAGGARLVLGIAAYGARDDQAQVAHLLEESVDGLLLSPNWSPEARGGLDWLAELPVPAVLVERRAEPGRRAADLDSVASDHRHGVLLALRHLASLGHDSVLLAARDDSWTAHQVRAGYAEGVRHLGMTPLPVLDVRDPQSPEAGQAEVVRLADRIAHLAGEGVHAVLVHNDHEAVQLPMLLRARGLRVPDDVALISYDDVFAALAAPPLTAVAPPRRAVGATAMELLLRRLEGGATVPARRVDLLPALNVRGSCGALC
ncbi:LacI family DNA-binding transcriptional regulator [Streptacidiphilus anmyonensis]|uniref:LacI family DNA-binding transcriptional regulator n=1 Tax=Streptacidiphilus anmyonensis TaxID=405782 RepID=UPI0005A9ED3A|nr:LacI family DNA-binding transcriptional regulator [Streptacidiphilus anmyonensis]